MLLDIEQVEQVGGGPGTVLVRVRGRSRCEGPAPVLLLDTPDGRYRIPPLSPDRLRAATPFVARYDVPLHLACSAIGWWLAPGSEANGAAASDAAAGGECAGTLPLRAAHQG